MKQAAHEVKTQASDRARHASQQARHIWQDTSSSIRGAMQNLKHRIEQGLHLSSSSPSSEAEKESDDIPYSLRSRGPDLSTQRAEVVRELRETWQQHERGPGARMAKMAAELAGKRKEPRGPIELEEMEEDEENEDEDEEERRAETPADIPTEKAIGDTLYSIQRRFSHSLPSVHMPASVTGAVNKVKSLINRMDGSESEDEAGSERKSPSTKESLARRSKERLEKGAQDLKRRSQQLANKARSVAFEWKQVEDEHDNDDEDEGVGEDEEEEEEEVEHVRSVPEARRHLTRRTKEYMEHEWGKHRPITRSQSRSRSPMMTSRSRTGMRARAHDVAERIREVPLKMKRRAHDVAEDARATLDRLSDVDVGSLKTDLSSQKLRGWMSRMGRWSQKIDRDALLPLLVIGVIMSLWIGVGLYQFLYPDHAHSFEGTKHMHEHGTFDEGGGTAFVKHYAGVARDQLYNLKASAQESLEGIRSRAAATTGSLLETIHVPLTDRTIYPKDTLRQTRDSIEEGVYGLKHDLQHVGLPDNVREKVGEVGGKLSGTIQPDDSPDTIRDKVAKIRAQIHHALSGPRREIIGVWDDIQTMAQDQAEQLGIVQPLSLSQRAWGALTGQYPPNSWMGLKVRAREARKHARESVEGMKQSIQGVGQGIREGTQRATQRAKELGQDVRERARSVGEDMRERAELLKDQTKERFQRIGDIGSGMGRDEEHLMQQRDFDRQQAHRRTTMPQTDAVHPSVEPSVGQRLKSMWDSLATTLHLKSPEGHVADISARSSGTHSPTDYVKMRSQDLTKHAKDAVSETVEGVHDAATHWRDQHRHHPHPSGLESASDSGSDGVPLSEVSSEMHRAEPSAYPPASGVQQSSVGSRVRQSIHAGVDAVRSHLPHRLDTTHLKDSAASHVESLRDRARDSVHASSESIRSHLDSARGSASNLAHDSSRSVRHGMDQLSEAGQKVAHRGEETLHRVEHRSAEEAEKMKHRTKEKIHHVKDEVKYRMP